MKPEAVIEPIFNGGRGPSPSSFRLPAFFYGREKADATVEAEFQFDHVCSSSWTGDVRDRAASPLPVMSLTPARSCRA
eukprot:1180623-Prorocentrum_minimum.AAC.2